MGDRFRLEYARRRGTAIVSEPAAPVPGFPRPKSGSLLRQSHDLRQPSGAEVRCAVPPSHPPHCDGRAALDLVAAEDLLVPRPALGAVEHHQVPRRLRAILGPCKTSATAPCSPSPAWSRTCCEAEITVVGRAREWSRQLIREGREQGLAHERALLRRMAGRGGRRRARWGRWCSRCPRCSRRIGPRSATSCA